MLKKVVFIIYLFPLLQLAQDFSAQWKGYFSYYNINEVVQGNNKIYAAANNAIFSIDIQTNTIEEYTTIQGLSGETISTLYYSEIYELLVVGYENGLIEIIFDNEDVILSVVDIMEKPTIVTANKRINHFNAFENVVYISTNFGISVFDLERLEFGDTYFIGNAGDQIQVNQTTIFGDYIYAACSGSNGLKRGLYSSANLIDFQNWETVVTGNYLFAETHESKAYTVRSDGKIYEITGTTLNEVFDYSNTPLDVKSENGSLVVTTANNVFIYDTNFTLTSQIAVSSEFNTSYRSSVITEDVIYIGTEDFGVLKTMFNNLNTFEEIHPDGPLLNIPFSIQAETNGLWVTYGAYTSGLNPYPLNSRGVSHLKNDAWINTNFEDLLGARCLNGITVNPFRVSQVFINSFIDGLLEVNEEVPTIVYDENNSPLEYMVIPSNPGYIGDIRIGASDFDSSGVLWTLTSRIDAPLKSYNPSENQWRSYSFTSIISDGFNDELGYRDIKIASDNTKWIASHSHGIIAFNENGGSPLIKAISEETENMPTPIVNSVVLDKREQLWIGTLRGLRVLYNTSNFFESSQNSVDEIVILEDGIAKELLFQQNITDIEVDGSNNKWIGTGDSGLFYFSSDGQKTLFHFTKDNSPLPSNEIADVSLDSANGVVYIATTKGLVSFNSGGSSPLENLENAYAFPNPVRPTFNIIEDKVKIKDISESVNIKITDIEGNLVAEAQSGVNSRYSGYNLEIDGGTAYWNGKNLANNVVASGVYLVMLSDLDSLETKVLKLMVVR